MRPRRRTTSAPRRRDPAPKDRSAEVEYETMETACRRAAAAFIDALKKVVTGTRPN